MGNESQLVSAGKRTWEFPLMVLLKSENSTTAGLSIQFHTLLSILKPQMGKNFNVFGQN